MMRLSKAEQRRIKYILLLAEFLGYKRDQFLENLKRELEYRVSKAKTIIMNEKQIGEKEAIRQFSLNMRNEYPILEQEIELDQSISRRKFNQRLKQKFLEKQNEKCFACGSHISLDTMEIDHWIPHSRGSDEADIDNFIALCRPCNQGKKTAVDITMFSGRFEYRYEKGIYRIRWACLSRDNFKCRICEKTANDTQLVIASKLPTYWKNWWADGFLVICINCINSSNQKYVPITASKHP